MSGWEQFQLIGILIFAAAICASFAKVIRLPSIVAFLAAGILIGPVFGIVHNPESVEEIAEIGIILLLFVVGLELSFEEIRGIGKVAVFAGLGQVLFTAVGGFVLCLAMGFNSMDSLFLAVALTFSSTVVVVKILTDKNELNSLYGKIAIGIFLVQDLVVMVVLTVLTGLGRGEADAGPAAIGMQVGLAFVEMAVLLAGMLAASRWVLPPLFDRIAGSPPTVFIWSLGWCFAIVGISKWLGLSLELGSFLAGLSLAQLPCNRDLQHRIKPLMNFFVAVFFVLIATEVTPGDFVNHWLAIVVLSLFVLIGNPLVFYWIIARMGYTEKVAFLSSVTVAQVSEFSFVLVAMGAAAGLVGAAVLPVTMFTGIITIAASAYMILYNRPMYEWFAKKNWLRFIARGGDKGANAEADFSLVRDHVIVVGMNSMGRRIVRALCERGEEVTAIDTDPRKLAGLPCRVINGNAEYLDVLLDAGLQRAKLAVSALRIEEANDLLAYRCRQAGVACCVHAVDLSVVDNLLDLGVAYLMLPKVDGVKLQKEYLHREGILEK